MSKRIIYPKNFNTKKVEDKPPLYCLVWRDAFSDQQEWVDKEQYELKDYIVQTVGYLIPNDNTNYYTLASTYTDDGNYCCIMNIPVDMVISKLELTTKKNSSKEQ